MSLLELAIGWVTPPECVGCSSEGLALCRECLEANVVQYGERCGLCNVLSPNSKTCTNCRRLGAPSHIWLATNYEGLVRDLVQRYKFDYQRAAAKELARLMSETYFQLAPRNNAEHLIVPIPTATRRVRERGFDHAALLAKEIAQRLVCPYSKPLARIGQHSQVGSSRSARLSQAMHDYYVPYPKSVFGRNILIVDDVMTTGGTLRAAASALRLAGAKKVDALVLAKKL